MPSSTGEEYRKSLSSLLAVVAFPEGKDNYRVFRDLDKPGSNLETAKEVFKLDWIHWRVEDRNPRGLFRELGKRLGLQDPPGAGIVFFPPEFEEKLLKAELAFAKMTEVEIVEKRLETRFTVTRDGEQWTVKVVRQQQRK